jgi:hypothetical protein
MLRHLAVLAALLCASLALTAAPAGAFEKAIWGPITRNGVNEFPLYHALGVKIYQDDLYWDQIAPSKPADPTNPRDPAYQWPAQIAQEISLAKRYRMRVMLQLISSPAWANGGHQGFGWAPQNPLDFAQFAEAAAREYPSVHLWMVWGEPTKEGNFEPELPQQQLQPLDSAEQAAPHLYARMLDGAYGALKHVNRRNLVIGGSTFTTGQIDPQQWLANMVLPNGKPPRLDMWGHNPFSYSQPSFSAAPSPLGEVQFSDLPELERWLRHHFHRTIPLFLSEFEIPTQRDCTFNFWVDPGEAAHWVTDALRLSRRTSWIYALGWINLYDSAPFTCGDGSAYPYEAGGLFYANGKPKPDYYAFKNG